METRTDTEIVVEVLAGNRELFGVVVDRYQRPLYNLMYRTTRNREEAAELTQDVFCQAFDKLASFRQDQSLFSWLYTLGINRAKDWQRRERLRAGKLTRWLFSPVPQESPQEKQLEQRQTRDLLNRALAELPLEIRELLVLRFHHERSIKELAEVFRVSESAVKMRLARSLEKLHMLLEEQGHGRN